MSHAPSCVDGEPHTDPVDVATDQGAVGPAAPAGSAPACSATPLTADARRWEALCALPQARWALLATALFLAGLALQRVGAPGWLPAVVWTACYLAGGWEPAVAGVQAARRRCLDVDLLMIVAAAGAAAIGQVLDGGLLIVIFAVSGAQEAYATQRTAASVRALLTLAPPQATRVGPDGAQRIVDATDLQVGEQILVRPGERIGADGTVTAGTSEIDQASITGEALPVPRGPGDEVFAGSLNTFGALRVRVGRPAAESVVAQVVRLVEQASATKARTQLFVEKIEQRYSVTVVAGTLLVFLVPLALGTALHPALLRAMTFMIVASPCAVVLATMPPLLSAIANAGRHGVLVKSAVVMEQLGQSTVVAFDKTGTLTRGAPQVVAVHAWAGWDRAQILNLAAGAEGPSEHPVGRAVVRAASEQAMAPLTATGFTADPGRGVRATVEGRRVQVGRPTLLVDPTAAQSALITKAEGLGQTVVVVLVDGQPVGLLALTDQLRPGAAAAVTALHRLTGNRPVLLTGDNPLAARTVAVQVAITEVRAGLLPADKVTQVRRLQDQGHRVLMVGDGINDAPALATAQVGVAMGGRGSDLAVQSADAVLVGDDLDAVAALIGLSRRARTAVLQNLVLAGLAIVTLVAWDLLGTLPLPLGVLGHEGGTVLIGLNGLRLLRAGAWRPRPATASPASPGSAGSPDSAGSAGRA